MDRVIINFILFWIFLLPSFLEAQDLPKPEYPKKLISSISIFAGANHSWFFEEGNPLNTDETKVNINRTLGIMLTHQLSKKLDLNLVFTYDLKGWKSEHSAFFFDDPNDPTISHHYRFVSQEKLKYSIVTVMPSYHFGRKKSISLGLGPFVGYLNGMETRSKSYREGVLVLNYYSDHFTGFGRYDTGGQVQIAYKVGLSERFDLNFRSNFNLGVANIRDPDLQATPRKNRTISLLIGLTISK